MFMTECVKIWLSRVRGNGMFSPFAVAGESAEGISVGLTIGYAAGNERAGVGEHEHTSARCAIVTIKYAGYDYGGHQTNFRRRT